MEEDNPVQKIEKSSTISVTPFSINDILNNCNKTNNKDNNCDDVQDAALDMSKAHKTATGDGNY